MNLFHLNVYIGRPLHSAVAEKDVKGDEAANKEAKNRNSSLRWFGNGK